MKTAIELFAARLRELREKAGQTQDSLSKASQVPLPTLRNWEQGRRIPALDAAARVAVALGFTLDELAYGLAEVKPKASRKVKRKIRGTTKA